MPSPPDETKWWFPAAESAFKALESDLGFEIVERHYHFQGNYIVYERDDAKFVVEAGSDWNSLSGDLWVGLPGEREHGDMAVLLASVEPSTDWRYDGSSGPVDRAAMAATMDLWAAGIAEHLPTLVADARARAIERGGALLLVSSDETVVGPRWADVEREIRSLDGAERGSMALNTDAATGLSVIGGPERCSVWVQRWDETRYVHDHAIDPAPPRGSFADEVDLGVALRAARYYFDHQDLDPQTLWERRGP